MPSAVRVITAGGGDEPRPWGHLGEFGGPPARCAARKDKDAFHPDASEEGIIRIYVLQMKKQRRHSEVAFRPWSRLRFAAKWRPAFLQGPRPPRWLFIPRRLSL